MTYRTQSEADTTRFAMRLSPMLQAGDSVLLKGDLGAGKSVIARGIARGMGIAGAMPSPTFTLMVPYEGQAGRKLYHFDLYRLSDPDEYYAAGLDEYVGGDGVAVIEWPEMGDLSEETALTLTIRRGEGEAVREIEVESRGIAGFDPEAIAEWRVEG